MRTKSYDLGRTQTLHCVPANSMERGASTSSTTATVSFPRVSLRALLLNSPLSFRIRTRRSRGNTNLQKSNVEAESVADSSVFLDVNAEGSLPGTSIKRQTLVRRGASSSSRRGSNVSKNVACRTGSLLMEGTSCTIGDDSGVHGDKRECPLCLLEVSLDLFPPLSTCHHTACLSCMRQYLTLEITESRVNISCPQCQELMHPTDIHLIINNSLLSFKFEDFMLRRVLSMDPDTRWCPAPDCSFAVIASGCAGCPKLKCERPGCESYFCYHCKAAWHPEQTCDMARAQRSPNLLLSSFGFLHDLPNNDDVKTCPRCQVLIMKMDDGSCNHMTCSVCGAEFCWLCLKEISDLHYLSPSGCTFWGKKPWSRKKKIMWQLGTLVGAPLGIALVAGLAVPAMIIGIPIFVGRKLHARYSAANRHRRNLATVGGVTISAIISPVLAGLAVSIGVPILLAYIYGVVPISLCRSGGCGVTTSSSGVRIAFDDENDMVFGVPGGRHSESGHAGGVGGAASIGDLSCGVSLSADSAAHVAGSCGESDRESASNAAMAGSIASSLISRNHRLDVQLDLAQSGRSVASGETISLAISERSENALDTENASMKALAGSLLHYKVCDNETCAGHQSDSASAILDGNEVHVSSVYVHMGDTIDMDHLSEDGTDRLDSVSAIIQARHMMTHHRHSVKGVTFGGTDHVTLTLDDDDDVCSAAIDEAVPVFETCRIGQRQVSTMENGSEWPTGGPEEGDRCESLP